MPARDKATLLIVEDDLDIADMLNAFFRAQGYEVLTVNWGEDGVEACQANPFDLVILDIRLPDIDGFEVARRLRTHRRTKDIPILFLTEKRERTARLQGLELQADDYITKPFDIHELRLRVQNSLERGRRAPLNNPITGAPEGILVEEELGNCLNQPDNTLLVVSLGNLDFFREVYGFVASDDLLRAVILMIRDTLAGMKQENAFIGHLTTTDFVISTRQDLVDELRNRLQKRLEQALGYFYRDQDRDEEEDRFRDKALKVRFNTLSPFTAGIQDLSNLKSALERMYRQVSH
ncbi:MAG: response regulator [Anaerolineae bacterium]|nr:response regulator [Anaerolineae bacterium]